MADQQDIASRTLTMTRTLHASRPLVWEAWSSPEHIAAWWGPGGMDVKVEQHDFEPGGTWCYVMAMPNGQEFITEGVYSEIVAPERIVSSAEFKPMTSGVTIKAEFEEVGEHTVLTFSVLHPTAEYAQQQKDMGFDKGWGSVFEGLDKHVTAMAANG